MLLIKCGTYAGNLLGLWDELVNILGEVGLLLLFHRLAHDWIRATVEQRKGISQVVML